MPELHIKVVEKKQLNCDTVGWLMVPDTAIDDVILHYPDDPNMFYLRRDFEKRYSMDGSYFADYRCVFGADSLSRNTVIYGNSSSLDDKLFGQLNFYRDSKFVQEHSVIYFATAEKTMMWEVFAVSIMDVSVPYNSPNPEDSDFEQYIQQVRDQSMHSFKNVVVTKDDKILTLSTMDFSKTTEYPNNNRFVVMARLIDNLSLVPDTGAAEINPNTGR